MERIIVTVIFENKERNFKVKEYDELKKFISTLNIPIRLDLHGVLDTIDSETDLGNYQNICCISYVGINSNLVPHVKNEMYTRIENKQIYCGFIVYSKGRNELKYKFTMKGSKADLNRLISHNGIALFIDDSEDHIESTKFLMSGEYSNKNLDGLEVFFYKRRPNQNNHFLINKIRKFNDKL